MYRFESGGGIKTDAILGFLVGVVVAHVVMQRLGFGGGDIFLTLIVVAVGGLWYHWRRVT